MSGTETLTWHASPLEPLTGAGNIADPSWPVVDERDGLDEALEAITERRLAWLPVLRGERFVGILGARDLVAIYKRARASNVWRLRDLADETVVVEGLVAEDSAMAGATIAGISWAPVEGP